QRVALGEFVDHEQLVALLLAGETGASVAQRQRHVLRWRRERAPVARDQEALEPRAVGEMLLVGGLRHAPRSRGVEVDMRLAGRGLDAADVLVAFGLLLGPA